MLTDKIRILFAILSIFYVQDTFAGLTGISDCPSIRSIDCGEPKDVKKLKHCICSCAIARLVNRQYVEIDYSQCSVFMQCRWGKSMKFNINIMTENQVYIYSEQMKVDSSKRFRVRKFEVDLDLDYKENYLLEIGTECAICDDSCKVISIDIPAIESITTSTSTTDSTSIDNIIIPLYAVVIPGIIGVFIILFVSLWRKRDGSQ